MDMNTLKMGAAAVAAVAIVGAGSYWYAASANKPAIATITQSACGLPATQASFGVPLHTIGTSAPNVAVRYGPIEAPQGGGIIHIAFDGKVDGRGREVELIGDTLHLPARFGRDNHVPERVSLVCRDGQIATVRYSGPSRSAATFNVVHQEEAALEVPEVESAG